MHHQTMQKEQSHRLKGRRKDMGNAQAMADKIYREGCSSISTAATKQSGGSRVGTTITRTHAIAEPRTEDAV